MSSLGDVINLNVGGVKFVTTRGTLTKFCDSMLATMFGSDLPPSTMIDGAYFIDRDPDR